MKFELSQKYLEELSTVDATLFRHFVPDENTSLVCSIICIPLQITIKTPDHLDNTKKLHPKQPYIGEGSIPSILRPPNILESRLGFCSLSLAIAQKALRKQHVSMVRSVKEFLGPAKKRNNKLEQIYI